MKRIVSLMLAVLILCTCLPTSLFAAAEGAEEKSFILPASLTKIEDEAFAGNVMPGTIVIPNTVTSIGSLAFEGCTGLTEVVIASRDITIAPDAFQNCGRDITFYTYSDSNAMLWALAHGYVVETLDDNADYYTRFEKLVSHSGFSSSMLQSGAFASMCVIVRTNSGENRLPDISAYNPIDIFRSDSNLYYIQFATEGEAEDCHNMLRGLGLEAEPDRIGANNDVFAQGVTIAENWGTNDTMGFDEYAPFVAERTSGSVTVAVIDSGVSQSAWSGPISSYARSFVGGSVYNDSARHGSKVASIMNDCLGDAISRVTLLPVKVVDSSSMYRTSVIIEGIKHAVSRGADVINLSLGWDVSEGTSPEIARQISSANAKGIHVVAAAGNGSGQVMFPANCSGVLAVSALTYSTASGYAVRSRTGSEIDYTAPGLHLTTSAYPNIDLAGDVTGSASTSFAAPQISAALALIKLDPTRSGNAVSVLNSCCMDLGAEGLSSSAYGRGLPQLDRLAVVQTEDILLNNMDEKPIPTRLWLGDTDNNFLLTWEIVPANATAQTVTATSGDPAVVAVQQFGNTHALVTAKAVGETVVTVTNGSVTKQIDLVVEQPVTEILITGAPEKLIVGKTAALAVAALPETAGNRNVAWKSSDDAVATVSDEGVVTAIKPGKVTITCEAQDGYGTSVQVTIEVIEVPNATSVVLTAKEQEISNNAVEMEVGSSLTLEAAVFPEDAEQTVYYSIFPQGIVTVSDNGVLQAVAPGTATVMVTASTGTNVYTGLSVTVVIMPESIDVTVDKAVLDIGETAVMSGEVLPENATNQSIIWVSRNPAVATVHKSTGLVTAVAPGNADITGMTINGVEASVTIEVRQPIIITFDANEGECEEASRTAYSGYEVGELPQADRAYWQFNGWYTEKSGGTRVSAQSVFAQDTTVYAQWTGMPYTVTFDANGGECEAAEMSARVGVKLGALPAATREYYSFQGWYTTPEGEGREVTADYLQTTTDPLELYARWSQNPYTMTFNPNGGECTTTTKTGTVDSAIGVLPEPTRAHYIFDGWFTALSGGEQISEAYVQTTTEPITVYAHWTPMSYVMTLDASGGQCSVTEMACLVDTEIGELPVPTRDYYIFSGWYTEGEVPVHVTAAYQQAAAENVTVHARWTANPYTVTFEANGGSCAVSTIRACVDAALGELPVPTRDFYTFQGWYTATTGGTQVTAEYVQSTDAPLMLYARWTANPYEVIFDANGGSCETASMTANVDCALGELPMPNRECYTFQGWYTAVAGGTQITAEYTQSSDDALQLYAHWQPGTYTLTLDTNGGTCATASLTGTVDQPIGTLPVPTRAYYTFDGWYLAAEGGDMVDETYAQATMDPVTIFARWTPMEYTMKFNGNGGTVSGDSMKPFAVDTPVGMLPDATRTYYTFDGWYTEPTGGTRITNAYAHPTTETIEVFAQWLPDSYTMYFNTNGGACSTTSKTCYVDTAVGTLPSATRDYYYFDGWYTAASGGTAVTAEYLQAAPASVTVYAHWTLKEESGWVLESAVPDGAQITQTSWSYRESTETTASTLSGWVANGNYWKQTGSGSMEYATFPSGEYDTTNTYYKTMNKSPYTASETATTKREVSNPTTVTGYIYWHWVINGTYAGNTVDRIIAYQKGTYGGLAYKYFYAIKSTKVMPKAKSSYCTIGQYPKNGRTTYDCTTLIDDTSVVPASHKKSSTSGLKTWRFYRLPYYTSTYKDYQKIFKYYRDLSYQTTDPGTGSNITNKVTYVKYRNK